MPICCLQWDTALFYLARLLLLPRGNMAFFGRDERVFVCRWANWMTFQLVNCIRFPLYNVHNDLTSVDCKMVILKVIGDIRTVNAYLLKHTLKNGFDWLVNLLSHNDYSHIEVLSIFSPSVCPYGQNGHCCLIVVPCGHVKSESRMYWFRPFQITKSIHAFHTKNTSTPPQLSKTMSGRDLLTFQSGGLFTPQCKQVAIWHGFRQLWWSGGVL